MPECIDFRVKRRFEIQSSLFVFLMLIHCMTGCTNRTKTVGSETLTHEGPAQLMTSEENPYQKLSALDQIIKKHADSIGYDKIKNVETIRVSGKYRQYVHGSIKEARYSVVLKRPDLRRFEGHVRGLPIIVAYDGSTVWMVNPFHFHGSLEAKIMHGMNARQFLFDTQFFPSWSSPIIDYRERGNTVKLVGTENIDGTKVHKLAARIKYAMETHWYISSDDYLLKRMSWRQIGGLHIDETPGFYVHICFEDYKDVNGNVVPHVIKDKVDGKTVKEYTLEQIEVNVDVDDAIFRIPQ